MKSRKLALQGYAMILLSTIGFGSYGTWSRLIGGEFGVFTQGWVRSALVLLVLIPIAVVTKDFKKVEKADIKWILAPVLFAIATQAPLYYAFNHMDIGTATLIFYAMFVITSYIVGTFLLGERLTRIKIVSLMLAFCGLTILFGVSLGSVSLFALLMAVTNGIASGGEVATTKKSTQKFSSLQVSIYVWGGILVTHLPLALLLREPQVPIGLNYIWGSMVGYAVSGLLATWLVFEGFKYVDASIGGLLGLFEILLGVFFGILFFHELLTPSILVGGGLIVLAAMLPDLSMYIGNHGYKQ